jgi:hypothetical protein
MTSFSKNPLNPLGHTLRKWLAHPWTVAIGAAIVTVVLGEVSPLRLFSKRVLPWLRAELSFLREPIQVPRWTLVAAPLTFVAGFVAINYLLKAVRSNTDLVFAGLSWESRDGGDGFRPICRKCRCFLQARVQPEERKDRNNIPFLFVPESPNVLFCPICHTTIPLISSWTEILKDAREFFAGM